MILQSRIDAIETKQNLQVKDLLEIKNKFLKVLNEMDINKASIWKMDQRFSKRFDLYKQEIDEKIQNMYDAILNKLDEQFCKDRQYRGIQKEIENKFNNVDVNQEVIDSLTLGRYMYRHQQDIFSNDASVIYLAYSRSVEKIVNPKNSRDIGLYRRLEKIKDKFKFDLTWLVDKRNLAAHTGNVTLQDVEKIDKELLENREGNNFKIVELLKRVKNRII